VHHDPHTITRADLSQPLHPRADGVHRDSIPRVILSELYRLQPDAAPEMDGAGELYRALHL